MLICCLRCPSVLLELFLAQKKWTRSLAEYNIGIVIKMRRRPFSSLNHSLQIFASLASIHPLDHRNNELPSRDDLEVRYFQPIHSIEFPPNSSLTRSGSSHSDLISNRCAFRFWSFTSSPSNQRVISSTYPYPSLSPASLPQVPRIHLVWGSYGNVPFKRHNQLTSTASERKLLPPSFCTNLGLGKYGGSGKFTHMIHLLMR